MLVDHYLTLGVSRHATREEIDKAYVMKRQAIPNPLKEGTYAYEKLVELNNAYNNLTIPILKKEFDLIYDKKQQEQRQHGQNQGERYQNYEEPSRVLSEPFVTLSEPNQPDSFHTETSGNYEETFTDRSAGERLLLPVAIAHENDEDLSSQNGETNAGTAAVEQLKQILPELKRCHKQIGKACDQITKIVNGQQFAEGWSS